MNFKDIVEKIFQMEEELDLFNKKIDGVYFWELVRFKVVSEIAQKTGIYGQAHTKLDFNSKSVGKYILNALSNIFNKNPFLSPKSDLLFIGHPRRKLLENGFWWDIYCDPIIENLKSRYKCLLLEKPIFNKHLSPAKTENICYLDLALFSSSILWRIKLINTRINKNDKLILRQLERQIQRKFAINVSLDKLVSFRLSARKSILPFFRTILNRVQPRIVIFLVSYGHEVFIEACKKLDIPTVEMQHGTISRYHTGYSFPGKKSTKRTFPDYFLVFGDYWKGLVHFSIPDERVLSVGYPFFEMETVRYQNELKKDQIIFISQGTIGEKLSKFAIELKNRQDFHKEIIYKLHPGEYARWKKDYPWLVGSGVRVIDDESVPVYQLLAQSKTLVGVYSTMVYEGLGMGLRTFLVDLPGIEYMDELIKSQAVSKIADVNELIFMLKKTSKGNFKRDHFFKPDALKNIETTLKKIIQVS
jgi:hypothetical protein